MPSEYDWMKGPPDARQVPQPRQHEGQGMRRATGESAAPGPAAGEPQNDPPFPERYVVFRENRQRLHPHPRLRLWFDPPGKRKSVQWFNVLLIEDDLDRRHGTVPELIQIHTAFGIFRIEGHGLADLAEALFDHKALDVYTWREGVWERPGPGAPIVTGIKLVELEQDEPGGLSLVKG